MVNETSEEKHLDATGLEPLRQPETLEQAKVAFDTSLEIVFGVNDAIPYINFHSYENDQPKKQAVLDLFRTGADYYTYLYNEKINAESDKYSSEAIKLQRMADKYQIAYEFLTGGRVREGSREIASSVYSEYLTLVHDNNKRFLKNYEGQIPRKAGLIIIKDSDEYKNFNEVKRSLLEQSIAAEYYIEKTFDLHQAGVTIEKSFYQPDSSLGFVEPFKNEIPETI